MITENSSGPTLPSSLELQGASPPVITTNGGGRSAFGKEYFRIYRLNNRERYLGYRRKQTAQRAAERAERRKEAASIKRRDRGDYFSKRYRANPEKARQYLREYRNRNRQNLNALRRKRYHENIERNRQIGRVKAKRLREEGRISSTRRPERKHPLNDKKKTRSIFKMAAELTDKTGERHCVDHIIPVAKGGWTHHLNLQPLAVNIQKNADPFWESETYKDWRDVPEFLWPDVLIDEYKRRCVDVT